jgi:hypothetical protein
VRQQGSVLPSVIRAIALSLLVIAAGFCIRLCISEIPRFSVFAMGSALIALTALSSRNQACGYGAVQHDNCTDCTAVYETGFE